MRRGPARPGADRRPAVSVAAAFAARTVVSGTVRKQRAMVMTAQCSFISSASYRMSTTSTTLFELNAAVENITDEDYRIHGSGVNQPGINAIVGGKVSW